MATDEALLGAVRDGIGTWRWYGWAQPTVSFGRNERVAGRFDPARLTAERLGAVRRPTGGRALLHDRELTYSVTIPLPAAVPWRAAYDAVNALLLDTLRTMHVPVVLAADGGSIAPDGPVCFDRPADGELTVHGRKLVGSAVWRQGDAYLQHGSILLHDDQRRLATVSGDVDLPPPAAALAALLPDRSDTTLCHDTRAAARAVLARHASVVPFEPPHGWDALLATHHRRFADAAWLWRR